ncbi:MAG: hypothetical protein Ta2B_30650 [Termitinemataceae bacterium]|nr:MAG: hypothetical protein Ta2B_30650 [Termitinemataceae bacterium]
MENLIDINFDFRNDSKSGDPDIDSTTLNKYHEILWNKSLPIGKNFDLSGSSNGYGNKILKSEYYKESQLSSDTMNTGYIKWTTRRGMGNIIKQLSQKEIDEYSKKIYTIGNFILFPCNQIDGMATINGARGFNNKYIEDRFDLTLECIRLYYKGISNILYNPLYETLDRYKKYFNLFIDFKGYCEYFLLQDMVLNDFSEVKYFLPFIDFSNNPCPSNINEYYIFINNIISFIEKRNNRILAYNKKNI